MLAAFFYGVGAALSFVAIPILGGRPTLQHHCRNHCDGLPRKYALVGHTLARNNASEVHCCTIRAKRVCNTHVVSRPSPFAESVSLHPRVFLFRASCLLALSSRDKKPRELYECKVFKSQLGRSQRVDPDKNIPRICLVRRWAICQGLSPS